MSFKHTVWHVSAPLLGISTGVACVVVSSALSFKLAPTGFRLKLVSVSSQGASPSGAVPTKIASHASGAVYLFKAGWQKTIVVTYVASIERGGGGRCD